MDLESSLKKIIADFTTEQKFKQSVDDLVENCYNDVTGTFCSLLLNQGLPKLVTVNSRVWRERVRLFCLDRLIMEAVSHDPLSSATADTVDVQFKALNQAQQFVCDSPETKETAALAADVDEYRARARIHVVAGLYRMAVGTTTYQQQTSVSHGDKIRVCLEQAREQLRPLVAADAAADRSSDDDDDTAVDCNDVALAQLYRRCTVSRLHYAVEMCWSRLTTAGLADTEQALQRMERADRQLVLVHATDLRALVPVFSFYLHAQLFPEFVRLLHSVLEFLPGLPTSFQAMETLEGSRLSMTDVCLFLAGPVFEHAHRQLQDPQTLGDALRHALWLPDSRALQLAQSEPPVPGLLATHVSDRDCQIWHSLVYQQTLNPAFVQRPTVPPLIKPRFLLSMTSLCHVVAELRNGGSGLGEQVVFALALLHRLHQACPGIVDCRTRFEQLRMAAVRAATTAAAAKMPQQRSEFVSQQQQQQRQQQEQHSSVAAADRQLFALGMIARQRGELEDALFCLMNSSLSTALVVAVGILRDLGRGHSLVTDELLNKCRRRLRLLDAARPAGRAGRSVFPQQLRDWLSGDGVTVTSSSDSPLASLASLSAALTERTTARRRLPDADLDSPVQRRLSFTRPLPAPAVSTTKLAPLSSAMFRSQYASRLADVVAAVTSASEQKQQQHEATAVGLQPVQIANKVSRDPRADAEPISSSSSKKIPKSLGDLRTRTEAALAAFADPSSFKKMESKQAVPAPTADGSSPSTKLPSETENVKSNSSTNVASSSIALPLSPQQPKPINTNGRANENEKPKTTTEVTAGRQDAKLLFPTDKEPFLAEPFLADQKSTEKKQSQKPPVATVDGKEKTTDEKPSVAADIDLKAQKETTPSIDTVVPHQQKQQQQQQQKHQQSQSILKAAGTESLFKKPVADEGPKLLKTMDQTTTGSLFGLRKPAMAALPDINASNIAPSPFPSKPGVSVAASPIVQKPRDSPFALPASSSSPFALQPTERKGGVWNAFSNQKPFQTPSAKVIDAPFSSAAAAGGGGIAAAAAGAVVKDNGGSISNQSSAAPVIQFAKPSFEPSAMKLSTSLTPTADSSGAKQKEKPEPVADSSSSSKKKWKCAACEAENSDSEQSCSVCLSAREPINKDYLSSSISTGAPEQEKKSQQSSAFSVKAPPPAVGKKPFSFGVANSQAVDALSSKAAADAAPSVPADATPSSFSFGVSPTAKPGNGGSGTSSSFSFGLTPKTKTGPASDSNLNSSATAAPDSDSAPVDNGKWKCVCCEKMNDGSQRSCSVCLAARALAPAQPSESEPAKQSSSPSSAAAPFSFGFTSAATAPSTKMSPVGSPSGVSAPSSSPSSSPFRTAAATASPFGAPAAAVAAAGVKSTASPFTSPSSGGFSFGVTPSGAPSDKLDAAGKRAEKSASDSTGSSSSFSFGAPPKSGSETGFKFGLGKKEEPAGHVAPLTPATKSNSTNSTTTTGQFTFGRPAAAAAAASAPSSPSFTFGAPGKPSESGLAKPAASGSSAVVSGSGWKCAACTTENAEKEKICSVCMVPRLICSPGDGDNVGVGGVTAIETTAAVVASTATAEEDNDDDGTTDDSSTTTSKSGSGEDEMAKDNDDVNNTEGTKLSGSDSVDKKLPAFAFSSAESSLTPAPKQFSFSGSADSNTSPKPFSFGGGGGIGPSFTFGGTKEQPKLSPTAQTASSVGADDAATVESKLEKSTENKAGPPTFSFGQPSVPFQFGSATVIKPTEADDKKTGSSSAEDPKKTAEDRETDDETAEDSEETDDDDDDDDDDGDDDDESSSEGEEEEEEDPDAATGPTDENQRPISIGKRQRGGGGGGGGGGAVATATRPALTGKPIFSSSLTSADGLLNFNFGGVDPAALKEKEAREKEAAEAEKRAAEARVIKAADTPVFSFSFSAPVAADDKKKQSVATATTSPKGDSKPPVFTVKATIDEKKPDKNTSEQSAAAGATESESESKRSPRPVFSFSSFGADNKKPTNIEKPGSTPSSPVSPAPPSMTSFNFTFGASTQPSSSKDSEKQQTADASSDAQPKPFKFSFGGGEPKK